MLEADVSKERLLITIPLCAREPWLLLSSPGPLVLHMEQIFNSRIITVTSWISGSGGGAFVAEHYLRPFVGRNYKIQLAHQ